MRLLAQRGYQEWGPRLVDGSVGSGGPIDGGSTAIQAAEGKVVKSCATAMPGNENLANRTAVSLA